MRARSHIVLGVVLTLLTASATAMTCTEFSADTGDHQLSGATVIESPHSYCNSLDVSQSYTFGSNVATINLVFDDQSIIENHWDRLQITYVDASNQSHTTVYTGTVFNDLTIPTNSFSLSFHSDNSVTHWGYRFTATPGDNCADFANNPGRTLYGYDPITVESPHNYCNDLDVTQHYNFSRSHIEYVLIEFDSQSTIENYWDSLTFSYQDSTGTTVTHRYSGTSFPTLQIDATEFDIIFHTDGSVTRWGWKFTATPYTQCRIVDHDEYITFDGLERRVIDGAHPYCSNMDYTKTYTFTDASVTNMVLAFPSSVTEPGYDTLTVAYTGSDGSAQTSVFSGSNFNTIYAQGNTFTLTFHSDGSNRRWGYRVSVTPYTSSTAAIKAHKADFATVAAQPRTSKVVSLHESDKSKPVISAFTAQDEAEILQLLKEAHQRCN